MTSTQDNQSFNDVFQDVIVRLGRSSGANVIAVGGSRGYGIGKNNSDFDLVLFAEKQADFDVAGIKRELAGIADGDIDFAPKNALATFAIQTRKFELFFRDLEHIRQEIQQAQAGRFRRVLHPLYPAGLLSTVAIGNLVYAKPLWQKGKSFSDLVEAASPFPDALRKSLSETYLTGADLARIHALKVRVSDPIAYLSGLFSLFTVSLQIFLFAINRQYPRMDKGALAAIDAFEIKPPNFIQRCESLFELAGQRKFREALIEMNTLMKDATALANAVSRPAQRKTD